MSDAIHALQYANDKHTFNTMLRILKPTKTTDDKITFRDGSILMKINGDVWNTATFANLKHVETS